MIASTFYSNNRQKIINATQGGITVISAYTQMQRGNDAAFGFEQESNFWWLTGVDAPDWWVIIDGQRAKTWLVAPIVSDAHQIFDGSLASEDAIRLSGVEDVLTQDEAMAMLRDLAKRHSVVNALGDVPYAEHFDFILNPSPKKLWNVLERIFNDVQDCRLELAKLRAIKQDVEIEAIKKAIKLTVGGFKYMHENLNSFRYEYEIEAEFSHIFRRNGSVGHAYDPIIASGKNACTLHYNTNNDKLKKGSVILMDVGARVDGYAADISRSYSFGQPTARQQQVHLAVQLAHQEIIKLIQPGFGMVEYDRSVDALMKKSLTSLGLLSSMTDDKSYRRYFPHAVGHGLGVDVHDSLGRFKEFMPGMVLTVEPGIYIPEEGIGVRIEDNILVTEQGKVNLSKSLPIGL